MATSQNSFAGLGYDCHYLSDISLVTLLAWHEYTVHWRIKTISKDASVTQLRFSDANLIKWIFFSNLSEPTSLDNIWVVSIFPSFFPLNESWPQDPQTMCSSEKILSSLFLENWLWFGQGGKWSDAVSAFFAGQFFSWVPECYQAGFNSPRIS